jgi:hypothetical protein
MATLESNKWSFELIKQYTDKTGQASAENREKNVTEPLHVPVPLVRQENQEQEEEDGSYREEDQDEGNPGKEDPSTESSNGTPLVGTSTLKRTDVVELSPAAVLAYMNPDNPDNAAGLQNLLNGPLKPGAITTQSHLNSNMLRSGWVNV